MYVNLCVGEDTAFWVAVVVFHRQHPVNAQKGKRTVHLNRVFFNLELPSGDT